MLPSVRAVTIASGLVLLFDACSGGAPPRPEAHAAAEGDSGVTVVPQPPLRGTLTRERDELLLRECGAPAGRSTRIADPSGDVARAFAALATNAAGVYVELRGGSGPGEGRFKVTELVRAGTLGEGPSCARPVFDGDYVVSGQEPSWRIEIRQDGIVYRSPEEPKGRTYPYAFTRTETGDVLYATKRDEPSVSTLEIALTPGRCIDSMSGEWRSYRARVTLDGTSLEGCAAAGVPPGGFGGGALDELNRFAGADPGTVSLWDAPPLGPRLDALLGAKTKALLDTMQVKGPLMKDAGVFYLTGTKRHEGGSDAAIVLADAAADTVNVILFVKGAREDLKEADRDIALPAEVVKTVAGMTRP